MISILIPIYNGIEFLNDSITSVINQTYKDWEILIGINGHSKNSKVYKIAKRYKNKNIRIFDLWSLNNKSDTLNYLVTKAKYGWIGILDVDDKWLPLKLQEQIKYIDKFDIIGTKCQYFGDLDLIPEIPVKDLSNFDFLKFNPMINSSCLIKKELCHWDSDSHVEDYKLWLNLKLKNYKFYNVDMILVLHRIHKRSFFNNKEKQIQDLDKLLKEFSKSSEE